MWICKQLPLFVVPQQLICFEHSVDLLKSLSLKIHIDMFLLQSSGHDV